MAVDELKALVSNADYYNRYDKDKHWDRIAVIAGRAMQAAEFNELQEIFEEKIKGIGNALYAEGTVIEGCDISFDPETKTVNANGGRIFLDGLVYEVEAATLTVPDVEAVQVGIWKRSRTVTEYEDATLRDPSVNTPMYRMEGAYRIVTKAEWGLNTDGVDMPFFPVYGISGGEMVTQFQEKTSPEYQEALARYDSHAHGHYVVSGLRVTVLESPIAGQQVYSVSEGEAHIEGREASLSHSTRLVVDELPDLYEVKSEVHRFSSSNGGVIAVDHTPIEEIKQVRVTRERTVTLTHGSYTGCTDELPDTSVFEVVQISQGALVFDEGTDFYLASNRLSWAPSGQEPAPGSRYAVTYHYRLNVEPDASTKRSITLSDLVEGSLVELDYTYRMPRRDIIVMYQDRSIGIVRGIPHRYDPVLPLTPPEAIRLAEVTQTWMGLPEVKNAAVQVEPMNSLNSMQSQIVDLYSLVARSEQRFDAVLSAPSSAYGVFVDPLFDDDMRDAGTPQTALIADQTLQLPLDTDVLSLSLTRDLSLDFTSEVLISQPSHTKSMKVNPYQAFDPLPPEVTLDPAVDHWTENIARSVVSGSGNASRYAGAATSVAEGGTMRQATVEVSASGFGPNEPVTVIFDGVEVACSSSQADGAGDFSGAFTIPAGIPTGTKLVTLQGTHTVGSAYFVGTHEVKTTINYYVRYYYNPDPLAQTFTLPESRHAAGVEFWLEKTGASKLRVDIREVSLGVPTQIVLASCVLNPSDLTEETWNRAVFDTPAFLQAGTMYALTFLTDAADTELGITELGDWDPDNGWVTSQAYQTGVLLSSSNADSWTPHQTADMAFRLLGANFSPRRTVELGPLDLTGVTDLMPLAEVQSTGAETAATFILTKDGAEVARMQAWQTVSFDAALTGEHVLSVELSGDAKHSPILGRSPQLLTGKVGTTGDYVSRSFACGADKRVMVSTVEYVPGDSSVAVYVETASGTWTQAEGGEEEPVGDGWGASPSLRSLSLRRAGRRTRTTKPASPGPSTSRTRPWRRAWSRS